MTGDSYQVATLAVLGGEKEMPWNFDRLVKVEITDALNKKGLKYDDEYDVVLSIKDVSGKDWPENTFSHTTIIHEEGTSEKKKSFVSRLSLSLCPSIIFHSVCLFVIFVLFA